MDLKEYFLCVFIKQYVKILKLTKKYSCGNLCCLEKNMIRRDFEG